MDKTQAFRNILQMRQSYVGTKEDHIVLDEALTVIQSELFPQVEKPVKKGSKK